MGRSSLTFRIPSSSSTRERVPTSKRNVSTPSLTGFPYSERRPRTPVSASAGQHRIPRSILFAQPEDEARGHHLRTDALHAVLLAGRSGDSLQGTPSRGGPP